MTKFYEYSQNNSGGSFVTDDNLCHRLFIEANSDSEANEKAEKLGCYWDGCADGRDCKCCGDRWHQTNGPEEFPINYGHRIFKNIEEYAEYLANSYTWTTPDVRIFYMDGTVKEFSKNMEAA